MRKRYGLILLGGALAALVSAASLSARGVAPPASPAAAAAPAARDDISKPDRAGDVKAKGLSNAERRAIDIVRVEAFGDAFGTFVTVTFAGNFEASAGRGRLSRAVAGIVLRPRTGRPTVVATLGPAEGRTAGGLGGRGPFAVARQGRKVSFLARGFDFTKFRRIEAKSFATLGRPGRAVQSSYQDFSVLGAIASQPGEDFWAAQRRDNKGGDNECERARKHLASARFALAAVKHDRDIAKDRNTERYLDMQEHEFEAAVARYEREVAEKCRPPAEDFGGRGVAERHPQLAGHHLVAGGFFNRPIDEVEFTFSAGFGRFDPQGVVFTPGSQGFRLVPVTKASERVLVVVILSPDLQTTQVVQLVVENASSGTVVEITPKQMGKEGRPIEVTLP